MDAMRPDECYTILEISPGATDAEIRSAWRELNKVWHPDRFGDDEVLRKKAEEKLKRINQAYEVLKKNGSRRSGRSGFGAQRDQPRSSQSAPEWKVRDRKSERTAKNFEQLVRWILAGKVVGSDQVWDPRHRSWVRVHDVPELARVIRIRTLQKWTRFAMFAGMLGVFLLIRRPAGLNAVIGLSLMGFAAVMMWFYRRSIS